MPMFSKTYSRARYVHHLCVLVCTLKLWIFATALVADPITTLIASLDGLLCNSSHSLSKGYKPAISGSFFGTTQQWTPDFPMHTPELWSREAKLFTQLGNILTRTWHGKHLHIYDYVQKPNSFFAVESLHLDLVVCICLRIFTEEESLCGSAPGERMKTIGIHSLDFLGDAGRFFLYTVALSNYWHAAMSKGMWVEQRTGSKITFDAPKKDSNLWFLCAGVGQVSQRFCRRQEKVAVRSSHWACRRWDPLWLWSFDQAFHVSNITISKPYHSMQWLRV